MFKHFTVGIGLALMTACAPTTSPRTAIDRALANVANPSAVIAAELAFARAAREEGQWSAFREYAADDAVMFVPQAVQAQEWLQGRADPAQAVQWQPHQVWMSCDGSLAVTRGAAQWPDGRLGSFVTVWERQRDGSYKWVLDKVGFVEQPLAAPDFIQTRVADCAANDEIVMTHSRPHQAAVGQSSSRDFTLEFIWATDLNDEFSLTVRMMQNGAITEVLDERLAPMR